MTSKLTIDAETERVAVALLRHLDWQPGDFAIIFLFVDVGPALWLSDWINQRCQFAGRALQRWQPDRAFIEFPERLVDEFLAALPNFTSRPGAVWLEFERYPADKLWNTARASFLSRLNERRFLLERDLNRPLIVALPTAFKPTARHVAPDLWHVRAFSHQLRARAAGVPATQLPHLRNASNETPELPTPNLDEYLRLAVDPSAVIHLPTALRATDELLERGRPSEAARLAHETLRRVRQSQSDNLSWGRLRDLSISLDNVGRVAQAQGDWAQAETVYRESLAIARQLAERLGGIPEAREDVAISARLLASASAPDAKALLEEAQEIYRALSSQFPAVERYRRALRSPESDAPGAL